MSTNGSRPIHPSPARCACLVAAFAAGVVAVVAVAAGDGPLDVVVGLVAAGVLAAFATVLHLVAVAPVVVDVDELPATLRATAPGGHRLAEPAAAAAWCALCLTNPAGDGELCGPCLSLVDLVDDVAAARRRARLAAAGLADDELPTGLRLRPQQLHDLPAFGWAWAGDAAEVER